jgi:hypothetical protein
MPTWGEADGSSTFCQPSNFSTTRCNAHLGRLMVLNVNRRERSLLPVLGTRALLPRAIAIKLRVQYREGFIPDFEFFGIFPVKAVYDMGFQILGNGFDDVLMMRFR